MWVSHLAAKGFSGIRVTGSKIHSIMMGFQIDVEIPGSTSPAQTVKLSEDKRYSLCVWLLHIVVVIVEQQYMRLIC